VLDFQRSPKPRNYLSRREQWRVLMLVMLLGMVILAAGEAGKAKYYAWLFGGEGGMADASAAGEAAEALPVDTRLKQRIDNNDPLDTFIATPADTPDNNTGTTGRYFDGVDPGYLDSIEDDSPFRREEQKAWFQLLDLLQHTDSATLEQASTGRVTFLQLFQQSDEYRGELVTVQGVLRRAHRLHAPANDCGLTHYYQAWITPADDSSNLVVVYCLDLPEGFPTGMKLSEEVRLTGFFFKRWLYEAQDTLRTAPVLLSKTVRWREPPAVTGPTVDRAWSLPMMFAVAALFAVVVTLFVYRRSGSKMPPGFRSDKRPSLSPDIEVSPGVGQALERLARGEEVSET